MRTKIQLLAILLLTTLYTFANQNIFLCVIKVNNTVISDKNNKTHSLIKENVPELLTGYLSGRVTDKGNRHDNTWSYDLYT